MRTVTEIMENLSAVDEGIAKLGANKTVFTVILDMAATMSITYLIEECHGNLERLSGAIIQVENSLAEFQGIILVDPSNEQLKKLFALYLLMLHKFRDTPECFMILDKERNSQ